MVLSVVPNSEVCKVAMLVLLDHPSTACHLCWASWKWGS